MVDGCTSDEYNDGMETIGQLLATLAEEISNTGFDNPRKKFDFVIKIDDELEPDMPICGNNASIH